jgi:hypothetical protein
VGQQHLHVGTLRALVAYRRVIVAIADDVLVGRQRRQDAVVHVALAVLDETLGIIVIILGLLDGVGGLSGEDEGVLLAHCLVAGASLRALAGAIGSLYHKQHSSSTGWKKKPKEK